MILVLNKSEVNPNLISGRRKGSRGRRWRGGGRGRRGGRGGGRGEQDHRDTDRARLHRLQRRHVSHAGGKVRLQCRIRILGKMPKKGQLLGL